MYLITYFYIQLVYSTLLYREYVKEATDDLLKDVCSNYQQWLVKIPFQHESLLIDRKETKLSLMEKRYVG